MFVVTVEFIAHQGAEERFLARVLQQAQDSLREEEDCLQFDVCRSPEMPGTILLYEVYRDAAAFHAHLDSDHFKSFETEVADLVADKEVLLWHRES